MILYWEQKMPSRQQKSSKNVSERYLMFGPNHIFVTLRWDDRRPPGHENVCRWFLSRYKKLLDSSKLANCVFLGKCSKCNLNFQNCSISFCLNVSKLTKWLASQSTAYALRNWQGKETFVRKKWKKMKKQNLNF